MKYILSCSGGKDSVASIILAHEHNEPLDIILFCEVMFSNNISGENPDHINFIYNVLKPQCEKWGYQFIIVRSNFTYLDYFFKEIKNSKFGRNGQIYGFPMGNGGKCYVQNRLKIPPLKNYIKDNFVDYFEYLGIAADEKIRLSKFDYHKISLLQKYNVTEIQAKNLCIQYGLLSPIYKNSFRGGCWFCPNCKKLELKYLRDHYPDLFYKLCDLENIPNKAGYCFNALNHTYINNLKLLFDDEDKQYTIFDFISTHD